MTTLQSSQSQSQRKRAYLDNNATTPLDPRVLEAMLPTLSTVPQNPSSVHSYGREAKSLLTTSRDTVAQALNVAPREILFNSGGTEGLNFLMHGFFTPGSHLITTDLEHAAINETALHIQKEGGDVTFLSPGIKGAPTSDEILKALKPNTRLIALSAVNGETGVKLDIEAIAEIAKERNIPLILDAVALIGKESFHIPRGVTAMAFSGHKFHGPKGVGFVFLRSSSPLPSLICGGGQEYQMRSGTENLPGIVGLAKAVEILKDELPEASLRMRTLRDEFEQKVLEIFPGALINGEGERVANTSNIALMGLDGEELLMRLDMQGVAASHGSACSSGALEPSRVLLNMGYRKERARSSLRFSLSRMTTPEELAYTLEILKSITS